MRRRAAGALRAAAAALALLALLAVAVRAEDPAPFDAPTAAPAATDALPQGGNVQAQLVADLWAKVKRNCRTREVRYLVDSIGVTSLGEVTDDELRRLQKTKIDAALDAYFAGDSTGSRREFAPQERLVIDDYISGRTTSFDGIDPRYRESYLRVVAEIVPTASGTYLLALSAEGIPMPGIGACTARSVTMALPSEQVVDPIVRLADIIARAANRLRDEARGVVVVNPSAEIVGEGKAPAGWTAYFESRLREALSGATGRLSGDTVIRVRPPATELEAGAEAWPAEIRIRRTPNAYEIVISVMPRRTSDFAERGLVAERDLPPVDLDDLPEVAQEAVGGAAATRLGRLIALGDLPQSFAGSFAGSREVEDYLLTLPSRRLVEFDLRGVEDGTDPDFVLFDGVGAEVAQNVQPARSPTTRRFRLDPGLYRLRVANTADGAAEYRLALRSGEDSLPVQLSERQELLGAAGDWHYGRTVNGDGRRACFATTAATGWSPQEWRPIRPFLWFVVEEGERPDNFRLLEQQLDVPVYYSPDHPVSATVAGRGWRRELALSSVEGRFQSTHPGSDVVDLDAIEAMTQGLAMAIEGTTADGRPAEVAFSLAGYQAAINAMLTACAREDLRTELIRR